MNLIETSLKGCFELSPKVYRDPRGSFIKTFQASWMTERGLEIAYKEEFYSVSKKGVIRGLHFQEPPHAQAKLVYCVHGEIMDVAVDIRKNSSTYGQHQIFNLSPAKANMVYLPVGFAHGFCALTDDAVVVYKVSSEYAPDSDKGILWNSVGISWPVARPVISARDEAFPALRDYKSPF